MWVICSVLAMSNSSLELLQQQRELARVRLFLMCITIKLNEATRRGQPKVPQNVAKRRISPKSAWWMSVSLAAVAEVHGKGWENPPA